jgi:hypothetical protein
MATIDFAKLKKNRTTLSSKLTAEVENLSKKTSFEKDERFWEPTVDKAKNGSAVIRFLPTADEDGEGTPFARLFTHHFQSAGGWYIENCLTSRNNGKDPCCEENTRLWDTGLDSNKNIARDRKRKTTYISNILIIKDPGNPDNVGKVFLYKYGKTLFDMITELSNPSDETDEAINPFDLWVGADFKMVIKDKAGYRNYDASKFLSTSIVGGFSDEEIQDNILNKIYSVSEFLSPKEFKSYEDLKTRLVKVLGGSSGKKVEDEDDEEPVKELKSIKSKKGKIDSDDVPWDTKKSSTDSDEDEDVVNFFNNMNKDDE